MKTTRIHIEYLNSKLFKGKIILEIYNSPYLTQEKNILFGNLQ